MTNLGALPHVTARLARLVSGIDAVRTLLPMEHVPLIVDQFVAHAHSCGWRPTTVKRRTLTVRQFADHLEPRSVDAATLGDVEAFLARYERPRTKHAYLSDLRAFYLWAVDHDLVDRNPAAKMRLVKAPKSLPKPIRQPVDRALTEGRRRTRLMVALGYYAGLRCCEIAALDGVDLWLDRDPPQLVVRDGKGGKDRRVFIHPELGELLADVTRAGPLFPGRVDGHVSPSTVSATLKRHLKACGVTATAHQLRHTFATAVAEESDGDVLLTAGFMGHESMNTTMGYIAISSDRGADVIARLYRKPDSAA